MTEPAPTTPRKPWFILLASALLALLGAACAYLSLADRDAYLMATAAFLAAMAAWLEA